MKFIKKVSISILVMLVINFVFPVMVTKSVQAADIMEVDNRLENVESYESITDGFHKIIGVGTLTEYQMINQLINRNPSLSKEYVENFVSYILKEAKVEGVNHDVLYGLMMHETGFLKFGGDVKSTQNNFGGLGATGNGEPGNSFLNVQIGIRAVTQHLKGYASSDSLKQACVDVRYQYINPKGYIKYVEHLGIQENPERKGWAAATNYGTNILELISTTRQYPVVWGEATVQSFEVSGDGFVGYNFDISAQGLLDKETLYRIWVCDRGTSKWTILSDWSSKKTVEFKPSKEGLYTFVVHVKHISKTVDLEDDYRAIDRTVIMPKSQVKYVEVTGEEVVGSKLSIISEATPSADTLYRIWVCDRGTGKWTILSDWSSKKTAEFTPSKSGTYSFVLHVKHKTKTGDVEDDYKAIDKVINGTKSQAKSFEVTGEDFVGSKLSITADATPAADTLYRIWVCDRSTQTWTILSDWSSKKIAEFTPSKAGTYTFVVHVKHKTKSGDVEDDYRAVDKIITMPKSQAKSFEVTGEEFVGSKLSIAADATPTANTLYRIWVCDRGTGKWTILSDWSSKKTAGFTPSKSGTYSFVLHVKYKTKIGDVQDDYKAVNKVINGLKSQTKSFEVTGEGLVGSKLSITANATPSADTLYRIWVCDRSTQKWTILSDWSSERISQFTPSKAGIYTFVVHVKHITKSGDVEDDYRSTDKIIKMPKSQVEYLKVTGEEFVGSKLSITADATPSDGTLYRIWLCDRGTGKWTILSDWSSKKIVEFKPGKSGTYSFVLHVKHKTKMGDIQDDYSAIDRNIKELNSKLTSFSIKGDFKLNSPLTIEANATPKDETLYQIKVFNKNNNKWIILSDYSKKNSIQYIPTVKGAYSFVVNVKHSSKSGVVYDDHLSQDKLIGASKLVVLDPGHGGKDPGAIGNRYKEKDLNLELAYKIKEALINKGYVVLMTRTTDTYIDLNERAAFANSYGADLLISVHHNSFSNTTSGVEVIYNSKTVNAAKSKEIATAVSANIASSVGLKDRGHKDQKLIVSSRANMPTILVEAGFISNPKEEAYVAQKTIQEKIARSIADTVYQYIY